MNLRFGERVGRGNWRGEERERETSTVVCVRNCLIKSYMGGGRMS